MHRYHTWLPIVVAASVAAGVLAFLSTSPDQSGRVQTSELGFTRLDEDVLERAFVGAAGYHRAANRAAVRERASVRVAQRWSESLSGDRAAGRAGIGRAPESPEAAARITKLATWADGIDPAAWRVVMGAATAVAGADDEWAVAATAYVRLASATDRQQVLGVPLVVQVAAPVRDGAPWRVRDLHVDAPNSGIRAYADPVVVHAELIDVVAPSDSVDDATVASARAVKRLGALRDRYAALPGSDRTTIWMVPRASSAAAIFGPRAPRIDDAHAIASTTGDGDIAVDLVAWTAANDDARSAALAHALTHVATWNALERAPRAIVEGVAMAEAGPATDADLEVVAKLRAGVLATTLVRDPSRPLPASDVPGAHAFGTWLLDVHGGKVAADLLDRLDDGLDPERAFRRVLGATPAGVDSRVRSWAAERVAPPTDDGDDATAGGQQGARGDEESGA